MSNTSPAIPADLFSSIYPKLYDRLVSSFRVPKWIFRSPDGPDVNIGAHMIATVWTLIFITTVVIATRIYTQIAVTRQFGLGDGLMIFSEMCLLAMGSMLTMQFQWGLGRHFYYFTDMQRIEANKYNYVGQAFGVMGPTFGRISFIVLLVQLFGTTKIRRWILWAVFCETFIVNFVSLVEIFAQCEHPESLWNPMGMPSKWCLDPSVQTIMGYIQGAFDAMTDLFLTCLPITMFWSLQMSLKLKLGLATLPGMSIFASVADIIKTVQLQSLGNRMDFTYDTVPFFTGVIVQFSLVNIAASIPLIRPLFVVTRTQRTDPNYAYSLAKYGNTSSSRAHVGYRLDDHTHRNTITHDGSSAENILTSADMFEDMNDMEMAIIKKTTYGVMYDTKKSSS